MRKSLTKGTKGKLFFAILLLFLGISLSLNVFKDYNSQVVDLLRNKRVYTPSNPIGQQVLLVSSIKKTDLEIDGNFFYIVESPQGFVFVETNPNDSHIQNTINNLPKHRFLLVSGVDEWEYTGGRRSRRKFYHITWRFREDMVQEFQRLYPNADISQLNTTHYVSRPRYDKSELIGRIIAVVLCLVGVGLAIITKDNILENKKTYDLLRTLYPELDGNWQAIPQHAKLSDKKLGLYVYKDSIISWNVGVRAVNFADVKRMRADKVIVQQKRGVYIYYVLKVVRKKGKAIDFKFSYRFKKITPVEINAFLEKLKTIEPTLEKKIVFKNI